MKMFGIVLSLVGFCWVGSLVAQIEAVDAKEEAMVDSFVAMDSGEARAWLYAATEDEIKNLFALAKKEGWNADQFSAACTQLVAQQCTVGASLDDRRSWNAHELFMFGFVGGIAIAAAIAGFTYLMQGDASEAIEPNDVAAPVLNVRGIERELARLRASIVHQGTRTRAAINQLHSSASSGSKHSHKPR